MTTATKEELLALLQEATAARVRYWDAAKELENALGYVDDIPDRVSDAIFEGIGTLGSGLDTPEDAYTEMDQSHVDWLMNEIAKAK